MNMSEEKEKETLPEDCPAELVELFDASKSEWRKGIIKQFIEFHEWRQNITRRLKRIGLYEKIIIGILSLIGAAIISDTVVPIMMKWLGI